MKYLIAFGMESQLRGNKSRTMGRMVLDAQLILPEICFNEEYCFVQLL